MSRREYPVADRYEEREAEFYRRPRRDRDYEDIEVDISRARYPEARRSETIIRERDDRSVRQPDFLREDYGRTSAGQLVVREERRDSDSHSRTSTRRSRAPTERVIEKDEFVIREKDRSERGPPYPRDRRSEVEFREVEREETRSRAPERSKEEEIDITIRRGESEAPSRPPPPRSEVRESEREIEEVRFRRGPGSRFIEKEEIEIRESRSPAPPPPRSRGGREEEIDVDIDIRERRDSGGRREREVFKEDIRIRERSVPPPRQRSLSRANLIARKEEEWIVRRPRSPPRKTVEEQEIIIRRRERSPSPVPEPPREPTPEPCPPPPPPLEPIIRPPIIQEVITHHRHIDHGVERARSPSPSPSPPPPPAPACPPAREEDLEIAIKRKGVRDGKPYEEEIIIDKETREGGDCDPPAAPEPAPPRRQRSVSTHHRYRSSSRSSSRSSGRRSRRYDPVADEAAYYNRRATSRTYPGEAYDGVTRDWAIVDVPPGTERVRMDGVGGGSQEITWQRYNGERRAKFSTGDRVYESEFGSTGSRAPPAPAPAPSPPPPAPAPPPAPVAPAATSTEIKITDTRIVKTDDAPSPRPPPAEPRQRRRDRMWTELTKDLVIREAIIERGYEFEETEDHFYVIEYLRYEDVLALVELTEEIRREREDRLRQIRWERERDRDRGRFPPRGYGDFEERIYEREYIVDRDGRRRYR